MPLRARVKRLEAAIRSEDPLPYVVELRGREGIRRAIKRTLAGRKAETYWAFVLARVEMTEEQWCAKYAPDFDDSLKVQNPRKSISG